MTDQVTLTDRQRRIQEVERRVTEQYIGPNLFPFVVRYIHRGQAGRAEAMLTYILQLTERALAKEVAKIDARARENSRV